MSKSDTELPSGSPSSEESDGERATTEINPLDAERTGSPPGKLNVPDDNGPDTHLPSMELEGRTLGEFHLLRRLGRGGMAEVWLGEQTSLKRQVAVKILRSDLINESDDTILKRFEQEAKAAAGLTHPNIVQVYVIGEEQGNHFIAQEYVQGVNLSEYLKRKGPPDWTTAVKIMLQAAAALECAAEAGIVHRDIKPENIMLTRKGEVKVTDFGLAQLTYQGERVNLTQVGMTMGTPLYMSPEQVNGQRVDHRSDIYSLGVTCYHMLAGRPPFEGPTAMSVAVQHLKAEPTPLNKVRSDLPPALCQIVHKMLIKDPDNRYESCEVLLQDVRVLVDAARDGVDATSIRLDTAKRRGRRSVGLRGWFDRPVSRQLLPGILTCLLIGGATAALGWAMRPGDPLEQPPPREAPSRIPEKNSALAQYWLAVSMVDDEEAWQAVSNYHNDPLASRLAREQLGLLYVRHQRLDEAQTIFERLLAEAEDNAEMKIKPYVGMAMIRSLQGEYAESQRIVEVELVPVSELLDSETRRLVRETIARNSRFLGDQVEQRYQDLFQTDPLEDPPPYEDDST